ncbi:MAG: L-seryl-tRNA(Sec) selenium transferase [Vicinamibacterales bacterium]
MSEFRLIPSIETLRQRPAVRALETRFGAEATVSALRTAVAVVRAVIAAGDSAPLSEDAVVSRVEGDAAAQLSHEFRASLQPIINATGVIVHTNLGRAPLATAAVERVVDVASGYCSLEYDLARGSRGRRDVHAEALLCRLTGSEAAVVVNNNAAATLLVLAALAAGREVIVSRGELVEIGGGFRVPDVMAQSGATLREVGTTNKTRASDYGAAINEHTALILRIHPSNFRIEGFTQRPSLADLVAVGKRFNIPVAEDLGSGWLGGNPDAIDGHSRGTQAPDPLATEPAVLDSVLAGVDLCCFSGDKLLGGPQAGIIVGRTALIDRIRTHPLMRALRVDKMTYAALEATLTEYVAGRATRTVPVQRMLTTTGDEIRGRAEAFATALGALPGWSTSVVPGVSAIGGGSAPGVELPTWLVAVAKQALSASALEASLRQLMPPVIGRIEGNRVLLDLRTVLPIQDALVVTLFGQI